MQRRNKLRYIAWRMRGMHRSAAEFGTRMWTDILYGIKPTLDIEYANALSAVIHDPSFAGLQVIAMTYDQPLPRSRFGWLR